MIAITGLQFHDLLHTYTQQDVELDKLFMDVCVYNSRVMGPAHVENVTELACRTALAYRGVSHVTIPTDVQSLSSRTIGARLVTYRIMSRTQWRKARICRATPICKSRLKF